jgi:hypothetical protein
MDNLAGDATMGDGLGTQGRGRIMDGSWRLRTLALVLALAAGIGCNPLTTVYFMMVGVENKAEPEFKLASTDKSKEVRVMILASSAPDGQTEVVGVDRQIGIEFTRQLDALCKANKEKVTVIPYHKVEKFKNDNPGWRTMTTSEIGRRFDVDIVIDVEVEAMSLYKPGSRNMLFLGSSRIDVSAVDLSKAQDGPAYHQTLTIPYPSSRGEIPVGDDNPDSFRERFVRRIATDLSWKFTSHTSNESYQCD